MMIYQYKVFLTAIFGLFLFFTATAQDLWSLEQCIDYGITHNIDVNLMQNKIQIQEMNLLESKAQLLPSLNMGSQLSLNFGRSIDGTTNGISYDQNISNQYWLHSSIDLFQGFVKWNSINYNKLLLVASQEEKELTKNKLVFDIITAYYLTQYNMGLEKVAVTQENLAALQYKRMEKFVSVGRESKLSLQELKSQWAADQLALTQAKNQTHLSLLQLKKLLRYKEDELLIYKPIPKVDLQQKYNLDSLFQKTRRHIPELRQQYYLLEASKKDLAVAKGYILPRLYLSAGIYTNFYDNDDASYSSQLQNNQNEQISLGIHIPILNHASTYSNIQRKRIAIQNQELQLQKKEESIYADIQTQIDNIKALENELTATVELYKYCKLSFDNTTKKLENGLANASEYEQVKQRMAKAEVNEIKARLSLQMQSLLLEFYRTGNWNHISKAFKNK